MQLLKLANGKAHVPELHGYACPPGRICNSLWGTRACWLKWLGALYERHNSNWSYGEHGLRLSTRPPISPRTPNPDGEGHGDGDGDGDLPVKGCTMRRSSFVDDILLSGILLTMAQSLRVVILRSYMRPMSPMSQHVQHSGAKATRRFAGWAAKAINSTIPTLTLVT